MDAIIKNISTDTTSLKIEKKKKFSLLADIFATRTPPANVQGKMNKVAGSANGDATKSYLIVERRHNLLKWVHI